MKIKIHSFKSLADGSFDVMFHGNHSDAQYIGGIFAGEKGAVVGESETRPGTEGTGLLHVNVKGTDVDKLPIWKIKDLLSRDSNIELTETAAQQADLLFQQSRKPKGAD